MPRTYTAFGLIIRSDFAFDGLERVDAPDTAVDLRFLRTGGLRRDGACPADPPVDPPVEPPVDPYFDIRPETQYLYWRAIGAFAIPDPDRVLVDPHDGVCDHLVSQAALGLVMSLVLERRGLLCLHASAVAVAGRAAVFLGDKGAGKSTTCGAMLARGHLPVSDDLVPVESAADGSGAQMIRPGFALMKLFPDSAAALALGPQDSDRRIHPLTEKMQKRMPVPVPRHLVPAGALFVLRRAPGLPAPCITRLPAHAALQQVLRYTFMARYGETRLGRDHLVAHMKRCAALVARVPVHDLMIPADLDRLPALADAIAATLAPPPGSAPGSAPG